MAETLLAYDIAAYDIQIALDNHLISGLVEIGIISNISNLGMVALNFIGGTIDSIKQNGYLINYTRSESLLNVYLRTAANDRDSIGIRVFYRCSPTRGFFWNTNAYNQQVWNSDNSLSDARYWIPCVDKPYDKAVCRLTVSLPANMTCVGNGSLSGTWPSPGNNRVFYQWSENYPIAPSAISLSACAYTRIIDSVSIGDSTIPLQYYIYQRDSIRALGDFINVPDMVEYFCDKIGQYSFANEKLAIIENKILEGWGSAAGQTSIAYGDMLITGQRTYEWLLARATAKQWFGNTVTPIDWRHIWLNEGLAAYFDALYNGHKYGELSFQNRMSDYSSVYFSEDEYSLYPIYDPPVDYLNSPLESEKGAWVIHMLRYLSGDSLFYSAIKQYINDSRYGNVSTDDLQRHFELTLNRNLDWFFQEWIYSSGHPDYRIGWTVQPYQNKFNLQIQVRQTQIDSEYFAMPIQIVAHSSIKDTSISLILPAQANSYKSALLDFNPTDIEIDPDNWILKKTTFSNPPDYVSDIHLEADSIYSRIMQNEIDTVIFVVGNAGSSTLTVSSLCDSSWLDAIPARLVIPPGEKSSIQVIFRGQGLLTGIHCANLKLTTNDPNRANIDIACNLEIYQQPFISGDANGNGNVEGADVTFVVRYLKGIGRPPVPLVSGDVNGDCLVAGSDVTYLVRYLKGLGNPPISGNCD
jgi:aminopeptidase N